MLFNSFTFFVFFLIVYGLYLFLPFKAQNRMLLAASLFFYGSWDWRFLGLLMITVTVDFLMASGIRRFEKTWQKKGCVAVSALVNFSILGFFKYYNFFTDSFVLFTERVIGWSPEFVTLSIVLPVGISFYTFQSMSYVTDVYYGRTEPLKKFPDYVLFVSFFPQLVAGPIERAQNLARQILQPRQVTWDGFRAGAGLFYWGLFKKMVIADCLAPVSDRVFAAGAQPSGLEVLAGVYAFALQIYGDFSGYSDMARGLGKMMGFEIMINFKNPYFVTNPRDFWRNWHISLSEWLRDNLYIPLGGSRKGRSRELINLQTTMLLGGLWHGANWTFVLWGAYHGALLCLQRLTQSFFQKLENRFKPVRILWHAGLVCGMFHLTCLGWLFFRAKSFGQIGELLSSLAVLGGLDGALGEFQKISFYAALFGAVWAMRRAAEFLSRGWLKDLALSAAAGIMTYFIFFHGVSSKAFIYFQF